LVVSYSYFTYIQCLWRHTCSSIVVNHQNYRTKWWQSCKCFRNCNGFLTTKPVEKMRAYCMTGWAEMRYETSASTACNYSFELDCNLNHSNCSLTCEFLALPQTLVRFKRIITCCRGRGCCTVSAERSIARRPRLLTYIHFTVRSLFIYFFI